MDKDIKKKLTRNWFINLQEMICNTIQQIEGGKIKFLKKSWERSIKKDEGGGCYYILENGKVFDKVGVNFSEVYGKLTKEFKKKIPGTKNNRDFWASGVSVVMHMKNPHVPAMHFNTRYIYTNHGWFGGGMDVTPCFNDSAIKKLLFKRFSITFACTCTPGTVSPVGIFTVSKRPLAEAPIKTYLSLKKSV